MRGPNQLRGWSDLAAACGALLWAQAAAAEGRDEVRAVLFGGLDAGRSTFVNAGVKAAPGGLVSDGFVLLGGFGTGLRSERDWYGRPAPDGRRPPRVFRHTVLANALGGWQWLREWGVVAVLVGPEMSFETLGTGGAPRRALRFGLRLHAEVWARPTPETLLTVTAITGSARRDGWGRVSWGWRAGPAYLGPEAALYADATGYRKWSLGLHLTDFALGEANGRVSAGWLYEEKVRRPGLFLATCLWLPL
ncbi:cellulose biosynthesis protein BcsS [Methylobacterium sp. WSM2598]|uniref:cellulose biosynthesis protein BcsS n=1 Tax=Methylobacterium sp. WSM2598 TaxID=398261 RepID=UPI00037754A5|nr:cellulose biosynthesis protein BcsS [Methylobacterium sp. WSM2598]